MRRFTDKENYVVIPTGSRDFVASTAGLRMALYYDQAEWLLSTTITENGTTASFAYTYGANGKVSGESMGNRVVVGF